MTKKFPVLQLTLVLGLGLATSACDTVSGAADSVGNAISNLNPFGDDSPPATPDNDTPPAATSDTAANTTPDLSSIPARPATSTPAQQQAAAQSLAADGAQARYSADSLRAGTEAAAPPPAAADVAPPSAQLASAAPPPAASPAPGADVPPSAQPASQPATPPSAALSQGTGAVSAGASAPVQTAALAPSPAAVMPPGAEPAVPANTPMRYGAVAMGSQTVSDAALGFQPSSAPPLNPSINQWVAAPIVAHYRQTASNAGIAATSMAAVPGKGSPDASGDVVANLGAVSGGPVGSIAAMNGGVPPTAVVYFPGDGSSLSAAARTQIRSAVAQYKAVGGTVRVVGHASSRTPNMPVEKHLELIFNKSQARANAVAQELIHEGVPADKVLIEAVGDSQPVYYESMPQGEDGNRRAEIFVQG